ncbi:siderophore ABC transporter substrate-binding protein [Arthrobacter psychrochitiniphilus]|uniref:Iron ABC transporter substrate-binding protein n=1 Tax=Arthrobacter psychrochitiniphilus TaxID=291045 RepID=A0A2V3DUL5_9MICC|nr:ABC transporter substrate-binding protein [Arthrobacter psychrochitiniphilus]NYG18632.1 iron complex transport system substrate-binding protein [Arthrobacter psychrochitiniphilus]PXA66422.1 iron ABC transporter substrate-binding protein [Arthrobacter psychrochitiniphilus]
MPSLKLRFVALLGAAAISLTACGAEISAPAESSSAATTITVEDNNGTHTLSSPPASVVATDNRTFQTLSDWGITLKAAAVKLMPSTNPYKADTSIVDLGNHREPNLEAIVAVDPEIIINGQRFTQYQDDFAKLAPRATILNLDPRDGQPFDTELKRQITVLGDVFAKADEAKKLNADFDAAIARVKKAYDPKATVMGVITSGGNINYSAPGAGRTLGPLFGLLGLTPALEVKDASTDHQGDDISVEAIAKSNPDWILVMDRDAAVAAGEAEYKPASQLLESSEALKNVSATAKKNIVYMPADTYTNEGIQTYTTFLNNFADALEGK